MLASSSDFVTHHNVVHQDAAGVTGPHIAADPDAVLSVVRTELDCIASHTIETHADVLETIRKAGPKGDVLEIGGCPEVCW